MKTLTRFQAENAYLNDVNNWSREDLKNYVRQKKAKTLENTPNEVLAQAISILLGESVVIESEVKNGQRT